MLQPPCRHEIAAAASTPACSSKHEELAARPREATAATGEAAVAHPAADRHCGAEAEGSAAAPAAPNPSALPAQSQGDAGCASVLRRCGYSADTTTVVLPADWARATPHSICFPAVVRFHAGGVHCSVCRSRECTHIEVHNRHAAGSNSALQELQDDFAAGEWWRAPHSSRPLPMEPDPTLADKLQRSDIQARVRARASIRCAELKTTVRCVERSTPRRTLTAVQLPVVMPPPDRGARCLCPCPPVQRLRRRSRKPGRTAVMSFILGAPYSWRSWILDPMPLRGWGTVGDQPRRLVHIHGTWSALAISGGHAQLAHVSVLLLVGVRWTRGRAACVAQATTGDGSFSSV